MTDDDTTHDRTDTNSTMTDDDANRDCTGTNRDRGTDRDRTDTKRDRDQGAPGSDDGLDRRTFMRGAASVAGAGAMAALSDEVAAASAKKALVVVARDDGKHDYSITMKQGGTIQKAAMAGSNDGVSGSQVNGALWNWNADSYVYTGEIDCIEGDGTLTFHFPDGAFARDDRLVVAGQGSNACHYSVGAANANVDLNGDTTEGNRDSDDLGGGSERRNRPDQVSGRISDTGNDSYTLGRGDPIQYVSIEGGHAAVECYRTGRTLSGGSRGRASVVYFYMGDGPFTTFFQNFTNLTEAMVGYDQTVLLKHDNQSSGVSWGAHNMADSVHKPTRSNFEQCLRNLTRAGYEIDLYVVSHGTRSGFKMSTGSHGSSDYYTISDIQSLRASFDGEIPLRMVYQCNCWGSELNRAWQELGADAAAGSRYVNFFPNQFEEFAIAWRSGVTFERALQLANTRASQADVRTFLLGDMAKTDGSEWNQSGQFCGAWNVLGGSGRCARDYFVDRWQHNSAEWNSVSGDGWDFVVRASEKLIGGDRTLRR